MKNPIRFLFVVLLALPSSLILKAEEKGSRPKVEQSPEDLSETFRCERFRSQDLKELKKKLIDNCNLSKPFSSSHSSITSDDFVYCCHTK